LSCRPPAEPDKREIPGWVTVILRIAKIDPALLEAFNDAMAEARAATSSSDGKTVQGRPASALRVALPHFALVRRGDARDSRDEGASATPSGSPEVRALCQLIEPQIDALVGALAAVAQ
jgi:hypothetical protein